MNLLHPPKNQKNTSPNFASELNNRSTQQTIFLKEFGRIELNPIRQEDESAMIRFHETLSEENIYLRFFEHISLDTRTLHERLAKVCTNTADSYAIVAKMHHTTRCPAEIKAIGRITTTEAPSVAAFALLMGDAIPHTDLPQYLLEELILIARNQGFKSLTGELLVSDHDTLNLCRSFGFHLKTVPEDGIVQVSLFL